MFIWGKGHKSVQKDVIENKVCEGCGRADQLAIQIDYDYSHIYWLFRSAKNVVAHLVCKNCGAVYAVDKNQHSALFEKLGGNPIPYTDRFGGIAFALLIAGVIGYAYLSNARRDAAGVIVGAGDVSAFSIRLGDCFNDDASRDPADTEISGVRGVPCAEPHDNEVYAVYDLTLDAFPQDDSIGNVAMDGCLQHFEAYVGRAYETSSLDIFSIYPTAESWSQSGDREVVCALYDLEYKKLQGTMRNSGI